jgi:hypothetical protein
MRLAEFASAQDQLELWRLISDEVWATLNAQTQQQAHQAQQQAWTAAQQKRVMKPKRRVASKVTIPSPPPPKPLPKPKPLYPAKPTTDSPGNKGQTSQLSANSMKPISSVASKGMATRGIAKMNAPADMSNSRNKPAQS